MKVVMKKYPVWHVSRLEERWLTRRYGFDVFCSASYDQDWMDKLVEKVDDGLTWLYRNTINKITYGEQKVKVRIDKWDTWGMYSSLGAIVLPMLKQIREKKNGAPHTNIMDTPETLWPPLGEELEDGDVDENHFKRWDYILDEMIFAFESLDDEWETQFFIDEEVDHEGLALYDKRIQKGFELFGKYYRNLWE